ncbi:MAG: DUF2795 domain-containing protein [Candidatus Dormibacteria bacterium]
MTDLTPVDLQSALGGVVFPASKQDLIAHAITEGADDAVLEKLERLDEGAYEGIESVLTAAFGDKP